MGPTLNLRKEIGSILLPILIVMFLVSTVISTFFTTSGTKAVQSAVFTRQKRDFYAAESTRSLAVAVAQDYLASEVKPTGAGLGSALQEKLPPIMPQGFVVENVRAEIIAMPAALPIPNGAFAGMVAPQSTVRIMYDVKTSVDDELRAVTSIDVTMTLAQVGLFQFMYFVDLEFGDFNPGPLTIVDGRIHANGDFCIAGEFETVVAKLTAAGRVMHGRDSRCRYRSSGDNTFVSKSNDITDTAILTTSNGNGCTKCGGTKLSWFDYARSNWNGNLLDNAHGVTPLRIPLPSNARVQLGADGDNPNLAMSNSKNLRFLVDPVIPGEPPDASEMKFSYKADIRIIDGVWYLRNPRAPLLWPGLAIWSDHPGEFTDKWGNKVGQAQLRDQLQVIQSWPVNGTPKRFSYYEYDPVGKTLVGGSEGVVSYGNLARTTALGVPNWEPGQWLSDEKRSGIRFADQLCEIDPVTKRNYTLSQAGPAVVSAFQPVTCNLGSSPSVAAALLNGTRSGIRDGHVQQLHPVSAERVARSKILTTNFDLRQFQAALADRSPGELGSYFGPGSYMGADFNGVVFITSTWPDSDLGFAPRWAPKPVPLQGAVNDINQIDTTAKAQQRALAFPLCSSSTVGDGAAGQAFDGSLKPRFKIPNCADYGATGAYPNSIRIINGESLEPANFKEGLSLVSNLPVYLQGQYNTKSVIGANDATPWLSSLVAGDQVTLLSDNWDDSLSPWDVTTGNISRKAASTRYNLGVITGWARSNPSVQLHSAPALMEDWQGQEFTLNGSVVIGFYPVYYNHGRFWSANPNITYAAGTRKISFDRHFEYSANQPPGSPLFYINQVINWSAK